MPSATAAEMTLSDPLALPAGPLLVRLFVAAAVLAVIPAPLVNIIRDIHLDHRLPGMPVPVIATPNLRWNPVIPEAPVWRTGDAAVDARSGQRLQYLKRVSLPDLASVHCLIPNRIGRSWSKVKICARSYRGSRP